MFFSLLFYVLGFCGVNMNNCLASAYFVRVRVRLTRTVLMFSGTVYVKGEQARPKNVVRKKVEQKQVLKKMLKKVIQKPVVKKGTKS